MSFPSKEERSKCWGARDRYWECLDKSKVDGKDTDGACLEIRKLFENSCSPQWVKHFDRKRNYLYFKERIEKHGIPSKTSEDMKIFQKRRVYHEIAVL